MTPEMVHEIREALHLSHNRPISPAHARRYAEALAADGYGWNDLTVRAGIAADEARAIVFRGPRTK